MSLSDFGDIRQLAYEIIDQNHFYILMDRVSCVYYEETTNEVVFMDIPLLLGFHYVHYKANNPLHWFCVLGLYEEAVITMFSNPFVYNYIT